MPVDLPALLDDLAAESADLDAVLASLDVVQWSLPTPAEGWSVADQVSHLAYFDDTATLAVTDPDRFRAEAATLVGGGTDFPDRIAARHHDDPPADLLAWFRSSRAALLATFRDVDLGARLPWYGPDMGPASSLTARLMETWAHGQDVVDALGLARPATTRLRHVADLGVRTRGFAFALRGRPAPETPVRVELTGPTGEPWAWGPPDAVDRVTGTALDFCLVVAQRRHVTDTDLEVRGPAATAWIGIAQVFAGAPSDGRAPRTTTGGAS
ncbi:TIGR03084 family metal-binding protein [Jatrophihabitans sp. YIM 134969]